MLLLAMSCLQGRTQDEAFDALTRHPIDGIQLTPGNLPSPGFERRINNYCESGRAIRLHHGFSYRRYRCRVFDDHGEPLVSGVNRSLHPPRSIDIRSRRGITERAVSEQDWLAIAERFDTVWETMMPTWRLGIGAEIEKAMHLGLRLAVDVSHLHIQRQLGVIREVELKRLFDYQRIEEIHVSHNNGRVDQHQPICADTPYLDWVRERLNELPVVLESYWHRASFDAQSEQIKLLRR